MALEGPGFRSLRQELSRALKQGLVETRPYTARDQPACLALVEAWRNRLNAEGIKLTTYSQTVACVAAAERFPPSLFHGLVVEVDGEVRGFAFSGPLTPTMGCNYLCHRYQISGASAPPALPPHGRVPRPHPLQRFDG
jgi:hypothetical protein